MDRSLDEIIAEDTRPNARSSGPSGGGGGGRRRNNPGRRTERDGVRKPYSQDRDRVDLNLDWVHDKFEDDRSRPSRGGGGRRGRDGPDYERSLTKVRVENLHYDITEGELDDLFSQIGPVSDLTMSYDRSGRSEGVAYITYARLKDAHTSIQEYDGANAKGQPIRLSLIPGRRERNPLDSAHHPRSSLMDRIERPRDGRSLSPRSDENDGGRRRGRGGRGHRSDVTKPPPDGIDRYVPGQRSGRSPAATEVDAVDVMAAPSQQMAQTVALIPAHARPRKSWTRRWKITGVVQTTVAVTTPQLSRTLLSRLRLHRPPSAPVANDDDVDMIE
ncbi:Nucleotide-binding alpha-beta plait [Penicillium brevicompactum]|uniref:Nucleotide-binding alpha-beta plait n=1 Tax=Penicillium brevicompactum TaxID=5074 RepID=UPI00253F9E82|nr:Nucleotide-binding alpha-beta plait [Penicillium brevicompactum]KAJ5319147.1 Nucleotide-binding alpha-beta plait [Penicillium brevicompactum]